ncbi:hypothetical protein DPV78_012357 [Talaromyces pinophilus]|nr:hypothetical protein DPV78_012357 [Talaromyces pinophilus]
MSFAQGFGPLALAPTFPQMMQSFNCDLAGVVRFTGVCILMLGFSNFICRPVLIISTLICLVSNIWRAVAKDYGSFMDACILNGIGAGPAETAQPTIIADVMFLHEIGLVISGPMAEHIGWRSFWWLNVGLLSLLLILLLILLLFLFPETKSHRAPPNEVVDVQASTSDRKEITQNIEDADESQLIAMAGANPTRTAEHDPYLHHGYPSKKQFTLWQNSPHPFRSILTDLWIL